MAFSHYCAHGAITSLSLYISQFLSRFLNVFLFLSLSLSICLCLLYLEKSRAISIDGRSLACLDDLWLTEILLSICIRMYNAVSLCFAFFRMLGFIVLALRDNVAEMGWSRMFERRTSGTSRPSLGLKSSPPFPPFPQGKSQFNRSLGVYLEVPDTLLPDTLLPDILLPNMATSLGEVL